MRKHERDMMNKAGLRQAPGAAAAAGDAAAGAEPEEEEAIVSKGHVITYCALDYPRIVDSVRWRLYTIKETLQVISETPQEAFAVRQAFHAQHSRLVLQLEAMHSNQVHCPPTTYCLHTAAESGLLLCKHSSWHCRVREAMPTLVPCWVSALPCWLCLSPQKEIRNNNAVQEYKCTHPQCGKEFSSMDVWQLISRDGSATSKNTFSCTICQSEVQMKLDLDGKELGSMNDKKQRQQVSKGEALEQMFSVAAFACSWSWQVKP